MRRGGRICGYSVRFAQRSHNSAEQARVLLEEDEPGVNVHVFNSCSAAAGEVLVALKIRELAQSGMPFKKVVREVEQYIYQMQTMFVLETLENLRKNGRLTKLQAVVTGALKIKLFMGATPEGEICKLGQALSMKQALSKLVDKIASDPNHVGRTLVICTATAKSGQRRSRSRSSPSAR